MSGVKGKSGGAREGAGRPPKADKARRVSLRLYDTDRARIIAIAQALRITQGEAVRRAVKEYYARIAGNGRKD